MCCVSLQTRVRHSCGWLLRLLLTRTSIVLVLEISMVVHAPWPPAAPPHFQFPTCVVSSAFRSHGLKTRLLRDPGIPGFFRVRNRVCVSAEYLPLRLFFNRVVISLQLRGTSRGRGRRRCAHCGHRRCCAHALFGCCTKQLSLTYYF